MVLLWISFFFLYDIGCLLIAKCRLQSHIYIYVIVIFYYLHKTYIQEIVFCLHLNPKQSLFCYRLLYSIIRQTEWTWSWGRSDCFFFLFFYYYFFRCSDWLCNKASFESRSCVYMCCLRELTTIILPQAFPANFSLWRSSSLCENAELNCAILIRNYCLFIVVLLCCYSDSFRKGQDRHSSFSFTPPL